MKVGLSSNVFCLGDITKDNIDELGVYDDDFFILYGDSKRSGLVEHMIDTYPKTGTLFKNLDHSNESIAQGLGDVN
jgi:hypothetical protein